MQHSLQTRLPPQPVHSDDSSDEEGSFGDAHDASVGHIANTSKALVVPDEAAAEARAALAAQKAEIANLLANFEVKVAAEQSILREQTACDIQMAFRRHRVRQRCQLRLKLQAKKEREAVRRIERA